MAISDALGYDEYRLFPVSRRHDNGDALDDAISLEEAWPEGSPEPSLDGMLSAVLRQVLNTLTAREARIMEYRFGLLNGRCETLEEVARRLGLTRERIRQIEAGAFRKLRHSSRKFPLRPWLREEG